jgi:hypothetical protein
MKQASFISSTVHGGGKRRAELSTGPSFPCRVKVLIHPAWRLRHFPIVRATTCAPSTSQAWWCPAKAAGAIVRAANANGKDVAAAARRLQTPVTPHDVVAERATEAVGRIDTALTTAQRRGDLAFFNQLYRAQRVAAAAQGQGFMSYGLALRRLRIAVAHAAANGGQCTRSLMLSVFADGEP